MTATSHVWILGVAVGFALAACASPEAGRRQGGGPGSDIGNRGPAVQMHGGAKMYYRTPCRTVKVKCSGPAAVFGT